MATCDYCKREGKCSTTGGGGIECDPPCPEVLAAAREANRLLRVEQVSAEADRKVQQSRLEAYQHTCHVQGVKLNDLATLLMSESLEAESGMDVTLLTVDIVHFKCETLRSIQEILKRK